MYCIVMAGGSGTRFWPKSRENKSKQFLTVFGKKSLIQSTVARFKSVIPFHQIYIIAKESQKDNIRTQLPDVPLENIILEPIGRDTAPCIGLASLFIHYKDPDAVAVVTPSDHLIRKEAQYRRTIQAAAKLAALKDGFVTVGIEPDTPATGYGYIQINGQKETIDRVPVYSVKTFAEKPNLATAKRFLESGDFYWNSGIFIFRVQVLLEAIENYLPDLYDGLMEIRKSMNKASFHKTLKRVYQEIKGISIDYGIMEKTKDVFLIKGKFDWNDLGNWEQIYRLSPKDKDGNVVLGNSLLLNTKNSYIDSSEGCVTVIGLDNVVVVQDGNSTLVCNRDHVEDVKKMLELLKRKKRTEYL